MKASGTMLLSFLPVVGRQTGKTARFLLDADGPLDQGRTEDSLVLALHG